MTTKYDITLAILKIKFDINEYITNQKPYVFSHDRCHECDDCLLIIKNIDINPTAYVDTDKILITLQVILNANCIKKPNRSVLRIPNTLIISNGFTPYGIATNYHAFYYNIESMKKEMPKFLHKIYLSNKLLLFSY